MYSRKDTSPNYIEFSKNQTRLGRFAWSQKSYKGKIYFEPCFQLFKKNELGQLEKRQQFYLGEKEGEAISTIKNTVIHDAENLGLVPILELTSDKESTMDQKLANCNNVYDIATYNRRQVCVTIKKYNVNKPPYIQIRIFTAKENEAMKQVANVNYTLNELKKLSQVLETLCLSRTVMYNKLCYLCFLSCNVTIYPQNHFSFSNGVEQYELEYWFFKKFNLKTSQ